MTQEYVGVDLSRDWLDVCDPAQGQEYRVKNTARSVRAWLCKLRADVCIVIEATSGCDALIMAEAAAAGVGLTRVNPGRARFFALSLGRAKTDRADARVLAEMGTRLLAAPDTVFDGNPYGEWIKNYEGDEYAAFVNSSLDTFNALGDKFGASARMPRLQQIFTTATRLERNFWQMGLNAEPLASKAA